MAYPHAQALRRIWGWEHPNSAPWWTKWLWQPWDFPGVTMRSIRYVSCNETPPSSLGQWKSIHSLKRRSVCPSYSQFWFFIRNFFLPCFTGKPDITTKKRWTSQSSQKMEVLKRTTWKTAIWGEAGKTRRFKTIKRPWKGEYLGEWT